MGSGSFGLLGLWHNLVEVWKGAMCNCGNFAGHGMLTQMLIANLRMPVEMLSPQTIQIWLRMWSASLALHGKEGCVARIKGFDGV